jgi:hypothetical protein
VKDFQDGEQVILTINEKGKKHRTIGIHFAAAEAISEGMRPVEPFPPTFTAPGQLFRIAGDDGRHAGPADGLLTEPLAVRCAPGPEDGAGLESGLLEVLCARPPPLCFWMPVSISARSRSFSTTATVTPTQIYDKWRRTTKETASQDTPV